MAAVMTTPEQSVSCVRVSLSSLESLAGCLHHLLFFQPCSKSAPDLFREWNTVSFPKRRHRIKGVIARAKGDDPFTCEGRHVAIALQTLRTGKAPIGLTGSFVRPGPGSI
jgi:hypothetical protein